KMSAIACPDEAKSLAPGASVTCTATYKVTQADVDAGKVDNSATATGTPPGGGDPVTSDPDETTVPADRNPALTLVKSADKNDLVLGETVTYSFVVTNTGNVTMSDVKVNEGKFSGSGAMSAIACPDEAKSLAPGASVTCTATYKVTQADVDAGKVDNSATATGTPPGGGDPVTSDPDETTVPSDPKPALEIVKSADKDELVLGESVTFSFKATNTGNVTLTDVKINEGKFTGSGKMSDITCPDEAKSMAPGASVTCTATYVVTQADVDNGKISNTATATGTPPGGDDPVTSDPSTTEVPSDPKPALEIVKSADMDELVLGESVTYSFKATNTGNVTLTGVKINEGEFTGSGKMSEITCPDEAKSLAPGGSVTCTATYKVTQADVDAGKIENSATATGIPPSGGDPVTSDPDETTVPSDPNPALEIVKSADRNDLVLGETVTYSFVVTNTGNVTMSDVKVNEGEFTGSGTMSAITCPDKAKSLAPGASVTCTATYEVTQADVDNGKITNTATATGTPPGGGDPVTSDPDETTVPSDPKPALEIVKSADKDELVAGETVTYSFKVTNTGNVTLTDVKVNEGEFTGSGAMSEITCPDEAKSMVPGVSVTCTATYEVTQADVDNGKITNTATATGTPPGGGDPITSDPDETTVPPDRRPELSMVKTVDKQELELGGTLTYFFKVTNTGNVTMRDVHPVEGDFSGSGRLSEITCPEEAKSMAPGASVVCTATYEVTQADVDAGKISNTATATGVPPGSDEPVVSPPSEAQVPSDPNPGMALEKTADTERATRVGQVITYSFKVTNTGNVSLTDIKVREGEFSGSGRLSPIVCPDEAASLAPGRHVTCTATYTVLRADLTGKPLRNTATATGTPPGGDPLTSDPSTTTVDTDTVTPPLTPGPKLPETGDDISGEVIGTSIVLLAAGAALVITAQRRRRR
ncbi:hypothetical protein ACIBNE_05645, partial [Streptomyces sp. NPDC050504]